jgi:HlyD family secretion protein
MTRRVIVAVLVAVVAIGVGAWYVMSRHARTERWLGYADADYVKIAPTLLGRLVSVNVARGDTVAADATLFSQEDTNERAARDQAGAALEQAKQKLADLKAPGRPTEITQAEADVDEARALYERAARDLARAEATVASGATTLQRVDQLRAQTRSAEAQLQSVQAKLTQIADTTGREHEIAAQEAAVTAAEGQLASAQWNLDQRQASAPVSGRVADTYARPGETIAARTPVVSRLPPENIFFRFYVPETVLARISQGQRVGIACDNCRKDLQATVSFVATEPEYTPPVIYSQGTRGSLVYMIEARPDAKDAQQIKPGQPVDVLPPDGVPAR